MRFSNRRLWIFGAIAIAAIVLLTLLAAPAGNKPSSGSTYNRAPDGYGAWYAFMAERGTPLQRWQKPLEDFTRSDRQDSPATFIRIYPELLPEWFTSVLPEQQWVAQGNRLVILGVDRPVTAASFSSLQASSSGKVKIDTRRREQKAQETLLGDRFGAVVWRQKIGKGEMILVSTPYLAANAYQDFPTNYNFLADLVTRSGSPIWVDEYIHGYKDKETIAAEVAQDFWRYLSKTPLFVGLIQLFILIGVGIWAGNRRFGKPFSTAVAATDNSKAYIEALAGVLQKAGSREFIIGAIDREERRQLQQALGLEDKLLDEKVLIDAWLQQTGKSPKDLESVLRVARKKRPRNDTDLLIWIKKWQKIRSETQL